MALGTEVMFVNHASLLVRRDTSFLLTDPWHQKPAFGSWLPTLPSYVHPAYLAALGSDLTILISHGHDDHCDDELLTIFSRDTEIVTAAYAAPSVQNRLKKLGFTRIVTADATGTRLANGFFVRAFINDARSLDDAIYTINTGDGLVIHCNDNWFEFDAATLAGVAQECSQFDPKSVAFLSQTNSASGYPMNYRNFSDEEKRRILAEKVSGMVCQGLRNAEKLGLKTFGSYAGFASVYVAGKPEYLQLGLLPTARFITDTLLQDPASRDLLKRVSVLDFYPGDVLDLRSGDIRKAFLSSSMYSDSAIRESTQRYYHTYRIADSCDTSSDEHSSDFEASRLDYFLQNFDTFVRRKVDADAGAFRSVLGKTLEVVIENLGIARRITFGSGPSTDLSCEPNKRLIVGSALMMKVLRGEILFENLYTGYEADWERFPKDVYNRDIVMFIVMFSYVYKNRLSPLYPATKAAGA